MPDATTDPSKDGRRWDDPGLYPASDATRVRRYRRLQSWYREVQLGAEPGPWKTSSGRLGSRLDPDQVRSQPDLNFLHPAAFAHGEQRTVAVQAEGGSLEPDRLRHNMLSSMPLCFNLFGALRSETAFIELFRRCFDPDAETILDVICEWAPQPTWLHLGDRTAFDAIVLYTRTGGAPAFVGIETKYTEPFSQKAYGSEEGGTSERGRRYRTVTGGCGWFTRGAAAADDLQSPASNQLWRNVMLAATVEAAGHHGEGWVAVVSLDDDPGAEAAVATVGAELADPRRLLRRVTLEQIVNEARDIPGVSGWAERFHLRYLAADLPGTFEAMPEATGPHLGRELTDPDPPPVHDGPTIRYGDEDEPLLLRPWRASPQPGGYPQLSKLAVGQHWSEAPRSDRQLEYFPVVNGTPLMAGLAVAEDMLADGADVAWAAEAWFGVYLDTDGRRAELTGELARIVQLLRDPSTCSIAGMPDAIGLRGDTILLRDAKRSGGRDRLGPRQHALARRVRALLGGKVELAVVEWDPLT